MIKSFFIGVSQASRSGKMIMLLVAVSVLVAFPTVLPIMLVIETTTGGRLAAEGMLAEKVDFRWAIDLFNQQFPGASGESTIDEVRTLLIVMGAIYLLLSTLLAGGALEIFHTDGGRFSMRRFWEGCGAYFGRFFRLMLISLLFYSLAFVVYRMISAPIDAAEVRAYTYAPIFYRRWGAFLLLILLLSFVNMVFDYAKIGVVVRDSRTMLGETAAAFGFCCRRLVRTFALYWMIALGGLALFGVFAALRSMIPQTSMSAVALAMLVGQMAIAARMWTRLHFYASQLEFYKLVQSTLGAAETMQFEFQAAIPTPISAELQEPATTSFQTPEVRFETEPENL
jgi:hypothetical protein